MSDTANESTDGESAEPTVKKYEVEVSTTMTAFVEVEAEDEDEAHDMAKEEARMLSYSDWEDDRMYEVVGVREMSDGE